MAEFKWLTKPGWLAEPPVAEGDNLGVAEAAKALGVGLTTCRQLIKTGALPSVVLRRRRIVRRAAIEQFMRKRERGR